MKVVNVRSAVSGSFVYIGRRCAGFPESVFKNPFKIGIDGDRTEVIRKYKQGLWGKMQNDSFCKALLELDGHDMGCWCAPLPCHGEVLIAAINYLKGKGENHVE